MSCVIAGSLETEQPKLLTHPTPEPDTALTPIIDVRAVFAVGEYERVRQLTEDADNSTAAALRVRAIANQDSSEAAAREVVRLIDRYPLSTELHLLQAIMFFDLKRDEEAAQSIRRVLYLDRSLIIAHVMLASILRRQGRLEAARRAYRNARDLAKARPSDEALPFAEQERAGRIVALAEAEFAALAGC
jgi:Flp pilus assembly protein TadD